MPTSKPETQRWAKSIGIDLTKKRTWRLDVILLTSGKLPTDTLPMRAPAFSLIVTESMWWVTVCRNRNRFSYAKWWKAGAQMHGEDFDLPKPRLASIRKWLSMVEAQWGVRFRRDRPFIRSDVKGAAKALVPWLLLCVACGGQIQNTDGGADASCTLKQSSYSLACNVASDCIDVYFGNACTATCACANGVIAHASLSQYQADFEAVADGGGTICPCPPPDPPSCCTGQCNYGPCP